MKTYIISADCISPQNSFENDLPISLLLQEEATFLRCLKPDYKRFISLKQLRRMSPIIRNGVVCSLSVLQKAGVQKPDAIIVGTGLGCLKDTADFLTQVIEEEERLPNPTHFIQSTHNTIAGQIALLLSCNAYNFTFSQNFNSFESALLDAQMLLFDKQADNVLVGGVDEMTEPIYRLIKDLPCYRQTKIGEGASFFMLTNRKSKVELGGIKIITGDTVNFEKELSEWNTSPENIDIVIGGDNEVNDSAYVAFKQTFSAQPYVWYKPFIGEFGTASGIAFWLGTKIIAQQRVPTNWLKPDGTIKGDISNVLIYNNKVGDEHSLMLLKKSIVT